MRIGYIDLWKELNRELREHQNQSSSVINICTGSEWYYFPSHFFLPGNSKLEFIADDFHGELPHHFTPQQSFYGMWTGSADPVIPFNDDNKEDERVYLPIDQCDYIVKVTSEEKGMDSYEKIFSSLVLDASESRSILARAFYIPFYSSRKNIMKEYVVYKKGSHTIENVDMTIQKDAEHMEL